MLAGVQFTHIMDFMVMMPLGPQFMRLFAISPHEFGWLVSSYTLTAAVAGFLAAFKLDHYDRRYALLAVYGGFTLATLLCALAPSYSLLLAARAAAGAFGGILNAVVHSVIGDAVPPQRRGRATGTVMMAFSVAAIAGVPVGLLLAGRFSWRAAFFAVTFASALIWLFAWRIMPHLAGHLTGETRLQILSKLRGVFLHANHRRGLALTGALLLGGFTVIPFVSPYLVANVGLEEGDLPSIYFLGGLATLVTSRLIGQLADRFGKKRVFTVVALLSVVPMLIITQLGRVPLAVVLMCTTLFFVLVSGRFVPAMALINSSVVPAQRGAFMSFNASVQSLCSAAAALGAGFVIGRASDGSLTHYGAVGAFASLLTVAAVWLARRIRLPEGDR